MSKESLLIKTLYRGKIDAETLRKLLRKVTHSVIEARAYVLKSYYNTSLLAAGVHPDWKRRNHVPQREDPRLPNRVEHRGAYFAFRS